MLRSIRRQDFLGIDAADAPVVGACPRSCVIEVAQLSLGAPEAEERGIGTCRIFRRLGGHFDFIGSGAGHPDEGIDGIEHGSALFPASVRFLVRRVAVVLEGAVFKRHVWREGADRVSVEVDWADAVGNVFRMFQASFLVQEDGIGVDELVFVEHAVIVFHLHFVAHGIVIGFPGKSDQISPSAGASVPAAHQSISSAAVHLYFQ